MERIKAWSHYPPGRTADFTGISPLKTYVNFQSEELEFIFFPPISVLLRFSLANYHLLTFSGWAPSKRIRFAHGFYPAWLSSELKNSHLLEDTLTLSEHTGVIRQSPQWEKPPERGVGKPLQVSLKRVIHGYYHLFLSNLSCFHISPFQLPLSSPSLPHSSLPTLCSFGKVSSLNQTIYLFLPAFLWLNICGEKNQT